MKKIIFNAENESSNVASKQVNNIATTSNEQKKVQKPDYKKMFVRKADITTRAGKQVSIRNEYHERIWKILHIIGNKEVTMTEYLDNIIAEHFQTFKKAIKGSYSKSFRLYCMDILGNSGNTDANAASEQEDLCETDYKNTFVHKTDIVANQGKQVSVRKEFHERIRRIVNVIGNKEVTIAEYLDNVITEHFKTFEEAIEESYSKNLKLFYI